MTHKSLVILGIRGVPAQHGGFETFAERASLYLIARGWEVFVYCQEEGNGNIYESEWNGIKRIHIPVKGDNAFSTIVFDLISVFHSLQFRGVFLTLGYNTALFNLAHFAWRKRNLINMDGIEWKRAKWSRLGRAWFWINERFGCWFGTHLIADHPEIKAHLSTRAKESKISMIPYGANEVLDPSLSAIERFGLTPKSYIILIARPEKENSILEVVKGFSSKKRDCSLLVLGKFTPENNSYHQEVMHCASDEVIFAGAIYDQEIVGSLRYFARAYLHGHQVGGTNPSLVEALAAKNPVFAHDNRFNRWVAGDAAVYFSNEFQFSDLLDEYLKDESRLSEMSEKAFTIYKERFTWPDVLSQYERVLTSHLQ